MTGCNAGKRGLVLRPVRVSIPIRSYDRMQPLTLTITAGISNRFQSPSGRMTGCNGAAAGPFVVHPGVSIPIRSYDRMQRESQTP